MTTFATSLPGRCRVNNFYLLYTGHNHYDCILDAVHHSLHLACIHDSESVAVSNTTVGARVTASCASVKRQRVRYQSIIATRRGCIQHSRNEPRAAMPSVDFRNRAILATKRLLAASLPFKHYGDSVWLRRRLPRCLSDPAPSHSASDAIAYSDTYDSLTKCIVCAICGIEGSRVSCVSVADVGDLLEMSGIATKFNNVVSPDRYKTRYDTIFNRELDTHFKDRLIREVDTICRPCYRQLLLNNVTKNELSRGGYVVKMF